MEGGSSILMVDSTQLQLQDFPNPQTSNQASVLRPFSMTVTRNNGLCLWIHVNFKCTKLNIEIDQVVIIPVLLLKVVKWYRQSKSSSFENTTLRFAPDEALTLRRL